MSLACELVSLDHYSEKQNRAALRVLDSLDQLEARLSSHYEGRRKHHRVALRSKALLCIPDPQNPVLDTSTEGACRVFVRSLSQSGLSFIYPGALTQTNVLMGMTVSDSDVTWFVSEIVRQRETTEEGFWEYGVRFLQRAVM